MDQLAEILTQPMMVEVFVSIILLVAIRPLYLGIFGIRAVNKDLDQAIRIVQAVGNEHQQDEFYTRFKQIHSQISRIRGLRHAWREFVDSMYFGAAATTKRVYLSHRPSHYFDRDSVLGTRLNLSQFLAYPNYLIGIGLTFTFIGLAAALHVAQAGLATGAGQQALKDLLAVASVKFISSIVGVGSSLVVSSLQRMRIMTFQRKLNSFCDLLEDCTEYKSTEKLLHDNIQEQRRHTSLLNNMPQAIAGGIGEAIGSQLSGSVAQALSPLMQELRSLAQIFAGRGEEAMKQMTEEFLRQLRLGSAEDLEGLIARTHTLKDSLHALFAQMELSGKNMDAAAKESLMQLTQMLERFGTSFAPVQQGLGQFAQALSSLEGLTGKIAQAGEAIGGAAGENRKSASELGKAAADMSASLGPLQGAMGSLLASIGKAQETASQLTSAGGRMAEAADGFRQAAVSIEQAEGRFGQKAQAFDALERGMSGAIAALESASARMGDAAKPLGEVSASMTGALKGIQETQTQAQRGQHELAVLLQGLQAHAQALPAALKQYEDAVGKADGNLGKTFGDLARGSEEFRLGIQALVTLIDEQFSKAIGGLTGTIRELAAESQLEKKDGGYFARLKSRWGK